MISRHAITVVILAALLLAMTAVATATKHIVNVGNFAFAPKKTQVAPGDTVRWVWSSGLHTTTSDPSSSKSWGSPTLSGVGQFFDVIFALADGPGPFPYHCEVHPLSMFDTIFVNVPPTVHFIQVSDFAFTPAKTLVNLGDTVIWLWESGIHTTTSDPSSFKSWNSPSLSSAGQSFQLVFGITDGPGPFPYHCEVHPLTMLDTIFVNVPATVHFIKVSDFAFTPAKTPVNPGDTVIWLWESGIHTTTSDPSSFKSWNSPSLSSAGQSFQLVFGLADGPGPFAYHCEVHPLTMLDTIFINYPTTVHHIAVGDFAFTPAKTHVNPGDAVIWAWANGLHNTTSDPSSPKSWTSSNFAAAGDNFQLTFSAGDGPGPFPYHCDFHPLDMLDTIYVNSSPTCTACGDANSDGGIDISDAVFLISYIFSGGVAPGFCNYVTGKGDANGDGEVDISDAVYLISYIFSGGPAPHCQ